jgi:hypothetical protein
MMVGGLEIREEVVIKGGIAGEDVDAATALPPLVVEVPDLLRGG